MLKGKFENTGKETSQTKVQKKLIKKMLRYPVQTKSSKLSQEQKDRLSQKKSPKAESEIVLEIPLVADQTPRFVTCVNHDVYNGNLKEYAWDQEKIFVHECLQDDILMLQNVFEGKIISALVYPLIFEHKSPQKEITLRSLPFYKQVENDPSIYHNLSPDEKNYFWIGLRDLFIASCRDLLSQSEKETLRKMVDLVDPDDENLVYKKISNINVAPYPTALHKMVRFIDERADGENLILEECFVRNELGLLIGFVDPRDLSFHNFENIINLDSLFQEGEDFQISNFKQYGEKKLYTFNLADNNNTLLSLDKYGLYTQPVNKLSRGGERFIFASQLLASDITRALRNYISDEFLINSEFKFVNYVFRYNKFKPGDRKFTSHYDTPYHDPTRKHYSKYTLILYLTPGSADPVLSIDNGKLRIDQVENNGLIKGVIFDQKYEHEGKSFIDSNKIFLRTELIYKYKSSTVPKSNDQISRKFNIACYMTKQSIFLPELEKYASDCFNQVAQARLDLSKANLTDDILVYKTYKGCSFITNGYDFWFLKSISLKDASIVAILDYFNCKYETNESFNKLTFDEVISVDTSDIGEVFECLKRYSRPLDKNKNKGQKRKKASKKMEEEECKSEEFARSLQCDINEFDIGDEKESEDHSSQTSDKIITETDSNKEVSGHEEKEEEEDDDDANEEESEMEEEVKKDETNKKSVSEDEEEVDHNANANANEEESEMEEEMEKDETNKKSVSEEEEEVDHNANANEEESEMEEEVEKDETNKKSVSEEESEEKDDEEDNGVDSKDENENIESKNENENNHDENKTKKEEKEEEEEEEDEEEDEDEDVDEERADYCSYCREYHDQNRTPTGDELEEYCRYENENTVYKLEDMKKKFTIFLFDKQIKIEKSQIKVTEDSIIFGKEMPVVNFAACMVPHVDFDNHYSIEKFSVKGYSHIPPIHYKTFKDGYHLKIELFNNGFVREESKQFKKYCPNYASI